MKKKPSPPKPKEFKKTPFATLKGLAVPEKTPAPPAVPPPPPKPPAEADDDLDLFFRAVSDVRPLTASQQGVPPRKDAPDAPPAVLRVRKFEEEDSKLFLKALEGMDVRFRDEFADDDDDAPQALSASRLKQLKQGTIRIRMELDLHGLNREQALESLNQFLSGAWKREMKAVLVITGKGNNSPGEPILQSAVAGWLRDKGKKMVVEFAPAPRTMGGMGAYVVFLRPYVPEVSDDKERQADQG